jgi:hypothetical protein
VSGGEIWPASVLCGRVSIGTEIVAARKLVAKNGNDLFYTHRVFE